MIHFPYDHQQHPFFGHFWPQGGQNWKKRYMYTFWNNHVSSSNQNGSTFLISAHARTLCLAPGQVTDIHSELTRTTRTPAFWDTPPPMITHTSDSHQIPSQCKTKPKLRILKNCKKFLFSILQETLHVTHLLKLLDKMYKYEMDLTSTIGTTERTRDAGRTDGGSETNILPYNFVVRGV